MIALELARLSRYKDILRAGAAAGQLDVFQFAGLMLRESEAGWAPGYAPQNDPCGWGDDGHAWGLFQIDKRYHAGFVFGPLARIPLQQALYAAGILSADRRELAQHIPVTDGGTLLTLCMYDSYNAGDGSVLRAIAAGKDPDSVTTGDDYGQWIIAKAAELQGTAPAFFG